MATATSLHFFDLLKASIDDLRAVWKTVLLGGILALCVMIPLQFLMGFAVGGTVKQSAEWKMEESAGLSYEEYGEGFPLQQTHPPMTPLSIVLILVFMVLLALVALYFYTFTVLIATRKAKGVKEGLQKAWPLFVPVIKTSVWMFLLFFRYFWYVILLWILPFVAFASDVPALGLLLFAVGGVVTFLLMMRFFFAHFILIAEQKKPKESVLLSRKRTAKPFWKVIGNVLILMLFLMALLIGVLILFFIVSVIVGVIAAAMGPSAPIIAVPLMIVGFIAYLIIMVLVQSFPLFFYARLSEALRMRDQ